MPNIDERVVQMTFDNKQFEKNVSQSIKSLDDLKKALELDKMSDSLKNVEKVTSTVSNSMSALEANVQKLAGVFTPFGNLAFNALNKISNAALDAGANLLKMALGVENANLNIDVPGQKKYESYTKAVQTITNATDKSVKEVSKTLDKLSKYTDETSYDFAEMVSSIGKFTSVGLDLERSEKAMEGIANWAAKSGAGKTEANRAMYNISQAMGTGAMKLIDWKSIENANMATKEFKETAIQTAVELGALTRKGDGTVVMMSETSKGVKETTVDFKHFNETLQQGWLNSDVLMETLEKYGDTSTQFGLDAFHAAQEALTFTDAIDALKDAVSSGWMVSLKYIFGDLDEARKMWTNVANALIEFSDIFTSQRNELLKGWHELGGYNDTVEAASNIWQTFMNIVLGVKEAFEDIFPPITATRLRDITREVLHFSEHLKEGFNIDTYTDVEKPINEVLDKMMITIEKGTKGKNVSLLKEILYKGGFLSLDFKDSDFFGAPTKRAIKKLQEKLGLEMTGVWDSTTASAAKASGIFNDMDMAVGTLKNVVFETKKVNQEIDHAGELIENVKRGAKGDWVKNLQTQLMQTGYLNDKYGADGIYGPNTEDAIKRLQQALGVEVTGAWDDATRAAATAAKTFTEVTEVEEEVREKVDGVTQPMLNLQTVVHGVASAADLLISVGKAGLQVAGKVITIFNPIVDVIGRAILMASDFMVDLRKQINQGGAIEQAANNIITWLTPVKTIVDAVAGGLNKLLDVFAGYDKWREDNPILDESNIGNDKATTKLFKKREISITSFLEYLRSVIKKYPLGKTLIKIYDQVAGIVSTIYETISKGFRKVYDVLFGEDKNGKKKKKKSGIETFFDVILKAVTALAKGISFVIPIIAALFMVLFGAFEKYVLPIASNIGEVFSKIFAAFSDNKLSSISEFFDKIKNAILESELGKKLKDVYDNVVNFFNNLGDKLRNKFPGLFELLSNVYQNISQVVSDIGSVFGYMYDAFKEGRINSISDFFSELSIAILSTDTGKKLYDLSSKVKFFFETLKSSISDKFGDVVGFFQDNVPKVIGFIKSLWNGIKEFFSWDPNISFADNIANKLQWLWEKIKIAANGIMELFGRLVDYIRLQFTVDEDTGNLRIVEKLQSLLALLKPITDKLKVIKDDIVNAIKGILGIDDTNAEGKETIFDKIKAFFKKISKINWGKLAGPAIAAVALYATLSGAKAIKNLSKGLLGLMDTLSGGKLIGKKDKIGDTALKIAGAILAIAAAVGLLAIIPADKAAEGVKQFLIILGSMTAAMILVDKFGKGGKNLGVQVLALAGSIAALAAGLWLMTKIISSTDPAVLLESGAIIVGMLALLGLIEAAIAQQSFGSNFNISGILQFCIGVGVIVLAFGYLCHVIKENIENPAVLTWAGGILAGIIVALGAVTVLFGAFNPTGEVKIKGVLGMCIGIGLVVLAFGHLVSIVKNNSEEDITTATNTMIAIMVGIGLVGAAMGMTHKSILTGISSTIVILALAYAIKTIADAFAEDILKIQDVDVEVMKTFFNGITEVVGIMGGLATMFGVLPLPMLIQGVIGLAAFIAILGQIGSEAITQMGSALWQISDSLDRASKHSDEINYEALKTMGTYLKDTLPETLASTTDLKVGAALDNMNKIVRFGGGFQNYATAIGSITEEQLQGSTRAETLAASAKNIFDTIKDITTVDGLAESLTDLGSALGAYYDEVSLIGFDEENGNFEGVPTVDSQMIYSAFSALAEAIPPDSIQTISGFGAGQSNSLTKVALGIRAIGKAIKTYGECVGDLNVFKILTANTVLNTFKGLYDTIGTKTTITEAFGILTFSDEEKTGLDRFATDITLVGNALGNYITATKDLEADKIDHANGILSLVSNINQSLPNDSGGFVGLLIGEPGSLGNFANNLGQLGSGLREFANATAQGTYTNVDQSLSACERLGVVLGNLDKIGGLQSWLSGEKNLSVLGEGLPEVGAKLVDFAEATKGFSYSSVSQPLAAFQQVLKFATTVGETYWQDTKTWSDHNILSDLGEGLKGLFTDLTEISSKLLGSGDNNTTALQGFIEFGNKISQAIADGVYAKEYNEKVIGTSILNALSVAKLAVGGNEDTGISEKFKSVGDSILVWIGSGIGRSIESWRTVLGNQISTGPTKIAEYKENYVESGRNLIDGVISGIVRMCKTFYDQLRDMAYYGSEKLDEKYDDYKSTGKYLIDGLVYGLTGDSSIRKVKNAATKVGNAIVDALNAAVDVNSPSGETEYTGEMMGQGLINGWESMGGDIINSMTSVADDSIGSIQDAFGNADISSDGIESYLQRMNDYGENLTNNIFQDGSIEDMLNGSTESIEEMLSGSFGDLMQDGDTDAIFNSALENMKSSLTNGFSDLFQDDGSIETQAADMLSGIWDGALSMFTGKISGGGDAKSIITNAISSMFSGVTADMSNFTVKPVLDFENMSIGGSTAEDIVTDIEEINEGNASLLAATESANQAMGIKYDIAETYLDLMNQKMGIMLDRMEQQNERISQLGNDMAQMKLYLDGDILVGGIEDRMYRNIDRKMARKAAMDARAR